MEENQKYTFKDLIKDIPEAIKGGEQVLTSGPISRAIFLLAVPMVLEMFMESIFAIVDIYWVGKISVNAVAAVSLTETVLFLVYSLAIGLSMAATAMIARRIGEKKPAEATNAATQSMIIGLIISIFISIVGVFFSHDILRLMGGEQDLIDEGVGYTQIMLIGNISIVFIFLLNAIFRGAGDASLAMRTLILANGLNLILDPLFIFGLGPIPAMGVKGAAIATTTGRTIGVLYQIYMLTRGNGQIKINWAKIKADAAVILSLLRVGSTGVLQFIIGSCSWIFLVRIIATFGPEVIAGYQISFRIIIFTLLPAFGIANAAATLVGQNLGADQPERAEKTVWITAKYTAITLVLLSAVFLIFPKAMISFFIDDAEAIKYGVMALQFFLLGYFFYSYGMVIAQAFNGAGDTLSPTIINIVAFWLVQIPLAYSLAIYWDQGPRGVFIAIFISESVLSLIAIWWFRKGRWKKVGI